MKYDFEINKQSVEIDTTRHGDTLIIERDGRQLEVLVVSAENNTLLLNYNGRLLRVAGSRSGDKRQLWVNGKQIDYRRVTDEGNSAEAAIGSLMSAIPAVVSELLVAVGDTVAAGDKLILLESMKMVIPIQATHDGTVSEIHCAAGDSVQPGVPLIEIT